VSQIETPVKDLVLGFFNKIGAQIIENNELFEIKIPQNHFNLFRTNSLKIMFNPSLSNSIDFELISPGSTILLKILNTCIDYGPVNIVRLNSNSQNIKVIRFYFYILFESIKTKTKIIHVDVDMNSKKIISIEDSNINFDRTISDFKMDSDTIDNCYVESITHIEQNLMKSEIIDFKNEVYNLKDEELQNIDSEYKKRRKDIQDKHTDLRSKGTTGDLLSELIDENKKIKYEEIELKNNLDKKFSIVIDFALIGSLILI
jgi:hypothetical protein